MNVREKALTLFISYPSPCPLRLSLPLMDFIAFLHLSKILFVFSLYHDLFSYHFLPLYLCAPDLIWLEDLEVQRLG